MAVVVDLVLQAQDRIMPGEGGRRSKAFRKVVEILEGLQAPIELREQIGVVFPSA